MYRLCFILLLQFLLRESCAQVEGRTPFCEKCKCSGQTMNNPDADCSDTNVVIEMFDPKYYSDGQTVYPIGKLSLQKQTLREIAKQFPTSALKVLDLSNNEIKNMGDEVFANLTEMEELILSNNNIELLKPGIFKGGQHVDGFDFPLLKLRILRLDHNKLHTIDNDAFQHIDRQIEVLDLSYNPMKILDQPTVIAITSIVNLKELNLSYTMIKSIPRGTFHTPKYLRRLDLSGNNFVKIPSQLQDTFNLETLIFNDNPITELTSDNGFPDIPTLKILHMCNNKKLETIGNHSLGGLGNLTELYLENNALMKIDPKALTRPDFETEDWPPIKKFSLYNNKLSYIEFALLQSWDRLNYLDLRENPWTCECENQWMLEQLMPIYLKISKENAEQMICGAPIEMQGRSMTNLSSAHYEMRCLDYYGNRPEKDGTVLIGILVGLLIGIPLVLFLMYAYQRHWFGLFDKSPAGFSRQFYNTANSDDF